MSRINQTSNLRLEEYPDQADWIGRLFVVLNGFMTSVTSVIDQNIDYATNIKSVTKNFDVNNLSVPIEFQWTFGQVQPAALSVVLALKNDEAIVLLPAWSYDASSKIVTVDYLLEVSSAGVISPISAGPRYKFTIRVTI